MNYILVAIMIVIVIILIYWLFCSDNNITRRKRAAEYKNRSTGGFDATAARALNELNQIIEAEPAADDYFWRGEILLYNMRGGEHAPDNINDYLETAVRLPGHVAEIENRTNPEFMLHRLEEFRFIMEPFMVNVGATLDRTIPPIRREIINNRVAKAVASADTHAEAVNNYFDEATVYTDDPQNVHDSKVSSDLRTILYKISTDSNIDPASVIESARKYMATMTIDPKYPAEHAVKISKANLTLDKIAAGETISTLNSREDIIFSHLWNRCDHPRNAANADKMREALIDSLADCHEKYGLVCINGRCGRLLNSFVTLDFDKDVAASVATYEAIRNQIFQETKAIILDEISRARGSSYKQLRDIGIAYESGLDVAVEDSEMLDQFKREIKILIEGNLERYRNRLNTDEFENITEECFVYATL